MRDKEWLDIFANNLCEIMKERSYTQERLSMESGIAQSSISKYMQGQQFPSIRAVINMSYALNVDLYDFIDFGDFIN